MPGEAQVAARATSSGAASGHLAESTSKPSFTNVKIVVAVRSRRVLNSRIVAAVEAVRTGPA